MKHSVLLLVLLARFSAGRVFDNSSPELLSNPNLLVHYTSKANFDRLVAYRGQHGNADGGDDETNTNRTLMYWDTVFFHLYTPETDIPQVLFANNMTAQNFLDAGFKSDRVTKIASHGWQSDVTTFAPLAKSYLETMDANILVLDWSWIASDWTYYIAAQDVPLLGDTLGETLGNILVTELDVSPSSIHCVGHSLGAHNVGHIARKIAQVGGKGKVARVTGLDPALPYFETAEPDEKILPTDADLVDIIHTNSGYLSEGGLSFRENLGHIDFFPNGGEEQPGCVTTCEGLGCIFANLGDMFSSCSHSRAISLFLESAQEGNSDNHAFNAYGCNGYEDFTKSLCDKSCSAPGLCYHMGEHLEYQPSDDSKHREISGYYLDTNAEPPFSLN